VSARIYVFDGLRTSRADTRPGVAIGARYYALDADRTELAAVFSAGALQASLLFRGLDGVWYKSGFAPIRDQHGGVAFAVGVEGAASFYEPLERFRHTLVVMGGMVAAGVVLLSVVMARLFTQPLTRLARAAGRIAEGDLETPVETTSRDEIGRLAETLESMRRALRARDERMKMMLQGIAHEVRNPLSGMELYTGLLRDELAAQPELSAHLRRIELELSHLKTIVGDFLDYARRPRPELAPLDVAPLLGEIRDLALAEAAERRVRLELSAPEAWARADAVQLRRALLTLAKNAVQACAADGSGEVELKCARAGNEVVVTVRDNGRGLEPGELDRIWTPFYTTKPSGTGLGLAFVREIAREHGARLEVASTPGRGTVFTLALPAGEAGARTGPLAA
jgi:signal transduction histidine kinase